MTKETEPYIALPPGYIVLSRADYDSIMERLNNVKACAFDDLKALNDDVAYLKKVLEEKQDEILTLQETLDEEKKEKARMLSRIDKEIEYNALLEKEKQLLFEFLVDRNLIREFNFWADLKKLDNENALPKED